MPKFTQMKTLSILFLLLAASITLPAQKFSRGTLVTSDGDTLNGNICILEKVVMFQDLGHSSIERFRLKSVAWLKINEDEYVLRTAEVVRAHFPERVVAFMRVVVPGPITLLEYYGADRYDVEHSNYLIEESDGRLFRVARSDFHNRMADFFAANEEISKQIREKQVNYDNLPAIVVEFNIWLDSQVAPAQ